MVEEPEESGLTGGQETEPPMEIDVESAPPLASGGDTTVTPKEDEMLMGNPTSVAGEMARLQVSSPDSQRPEQDATRQ